MPERGARASVCQGMLATFILIFTPVVIAALVLLPATLRERIAMGCKKQPSRPTRYRRARPTARTEPAQTD
ncbi:hypothetical protein [Sphingomonas montanisoli]|uniref:hypothetical protein n=1 Tax=Sphingomonas montanisoli TaxID=2606412 RepID=UPI0011F39CA5|nr:hypothetical protein [Sphingomonas montanisoli]